MIWHNFTNLVTKLCFLESKRTFLNFFCKHDSCVFAGHQLSHPRRKQSMVAKVFNNDSILLLVRLISIIFLFSNRRFVKLGVGHKQLFNVFHSFDDRSRVSFAECNDVVVLSCQIQLGSARILLLVSCFFFSLLLCSEDVISLVQHFQRSFRLSSAKQRIELHLPTFDLGNVHFGFSFKISSVRKFTFDSFDDRQHIIRLTNRYVRLVSWCIPPSSLVL